MTDLRAVRVILREAQACLTRDGAGAAGGGDTQDEGEGMIPRYSFVRDLLGRYDMPGVITDTYEVDGKRNYRVAWPGRSSAHWEAPDALAPVEDAPVMAVFELLYDDCYPIGRAERTWKAAS